MNKYFEAFCRFWVKRGYTFEIIATYDEYVFMKNGYYRRIFSELFKDEDSEEPEWWFVAIWSGSNDELTTKYNIDWGRMYEPIF